MRCQFEEVYSSGQVEQGLLLLKENKIRYEYLDRNLFTIFAKNKEFFIVRNNQLNHFQKINENNEVIYYLLNIAANFPDIDSEYRNNDLSIKIEKNFNDQFVKRMSIKSDKVNLSIYFNTCEKIKIHERFFNHSPYFNYEYR